MLQYLQEVQEDSNVFNEVFGSILRRKRHIVAKLNGV